ncbi:MAG TPA: nuclear transport factor 2 family protein [Gemmatimonadales bacterium]|nr:nuclear transport factor 2 family protein [Gemmatimonadales bacterium]
MRPKDLTQGEVMRWLTLSCTLAAGALAACTSSDQLTQQQRAIEQQALQDRLRAWERAMNAKNADSLAGLYYQGPEVTVARPSGRRTRGWQEEQRAQTEFVGRTQTINLVIQSTTADAITATLGLTTFGYSADVTDTSGVRTLYAGAGTGVWTKEPGDNTWKIWALHLSQNAPETAAPAGRRR